MLQAGWSRVQFPMKSLDFSIDLILPAAAHYGPGVDSASNRNEYRNISGGKGDNLTAICETTV
jgi:hypothetical protein